MKNERTKRNQKRKGSKPFRNTLRSGANTNSHNPPIVRFSPNVFGFPDRLLTRLRYADVKNITSTIGALGTAVFRWNSCYDPDFSGVGHQPLYRDTYASVYDQYAVVRATARFTFVNVSTTISAIVGHVTDDDTSISGNFNVLMEQSHGSRAILTPLAGSKSAHTFDVNWDCQEVLGIDPFTSQTYKTSVSTDPSETSALGLWVIAQDGTSTITLQVVIEIIQEVLWTELSTPTIS